MTHFRRRFAVPTAVLGMMVAHPALADPFFDAALCKPPYTTDSATALYETAEKTATRDTSQKGAAVYKLPAPITQDEFSAAAVLFAGTAFGVLVDGQQADALAARYHLQREKSNLFGTSSKGFALALPGADQPRPNDGIVSIVARESRGFPGKTLLACEYVSNEDRLGLEAYEKSRGQ